ncbi:MAG: DUF6677 family protein [Acidobacteriota bacterium]
MIERMSWTKFKRSLISMILTWLIPGIGHLYLGKKGRAVVFFIVVHLTFILGFVADGRFFLVDQRQPFMSYLQTATNMAAGPLDIVGRVYVYGSPAYFLPGEEEARSSFLMTRMRERMKSQGSAYGTAYLLTAGLMNLLLMLDVFDISIGRKE